MNKFIKNLGIAVLIFLVLSSIFYFTVGEKTPATEVPLSQVAEQITRGDVQKIESRENELVITLKDGTQEVSSKEAESSLTESLANLGVSQDALRAITYETKGPSGTSLFLSSILPFLIPFLLIGGFIFFLMRQVSR